MTSEKLQAARDYEATQSAVIHPEERPLFHVTATAGWLNDPNGFSCYQGEYHLFYQYHPYTNQWGPMHWGHVKSKDLIHWERLSAALAPDEAYDSFGCFSGSALELSDGRHMLMYTGVRRVSREDGTEVDLQEQCIAFGDGVNYEKYEGNPVITGELLPEGCSRVDFRDPKLWQAPDGSFRAVVANDRGDGSGQILAFGSPDGKQWKLLGTVDASDGKLGKMWECPDYFPLEGRQVLLTSPIGMEPQGLEFHAGNGVICLIGGVEQECFVRQTVHTVDYGTDFYAPQTTLAPDGRRILIGWMQNWATSSFVPEGAKYFGQLTLPRELGIRDDRMTQNPVRELERYRKNGVIHRDVFVSEETELEGVWGTCIDLTVVIRPEPGCKSVTIKLRKGERHETRVTLLPKEGVLRVDRSRSGYLYDIVHVRDIPVTLTEGALSLRMILDRFSLELFADGGKQAASFVLFTPRREQGICFAADGTARLDVEKYDLLL